MEITVTMSILLEERFLNEVYVELYGSIGFHILLIHGFIRIAKIEYMSERALLGKNKALRRVSDSSIWRRFSHCHEKHIAVLRGNLAETVSHLVAPCVG